MPRIKIQADTTRVRRNLDRYAKALVVAQTNTAKETEKDAELLIQSMILSGKISGLQANALSTLRKKGSDQPLVDQGTYGRSWRAKAAGSRVVVAPQGSHQGLDMQILAGMLQNGTSRMVGRPHVQQLTEAVGRLFVKNLQKNVRAARV